MAHSCRPKQPKWGARDAVASSRRWMAVTTGSCEATYDGVTVTGSRDGCCATSSTTAAPYPLSPAYSGASSSTTPNPGCQRRSWLGR